ncbi:hypothetical protein [Pseudomonas sp. R151218B TE3479]
MKPSVQQYARSAGARFHDQGTRVEAGLSVIRSWGAPVTIGSYPRPTLICAQFNNAASFDEARYFGQADNVHSGFLTPPLSHAFISSFKQLSGHFHCRRGFVYQVGVSEKLMI